jgi:hypothetical protein
MRALIDSLFPHFLKRAAAVEAEAAKVEEEILPAEEPPAIVKRPAAPKIPSIPSFIPRNRYQHVMPAGTTQAAAR